MRARMRRIIAAYTSDEAIMFGLLLAFGLTLMEVAQTAANAWDGPILPVL